MYQIIRIKFTGSYDALPLTNSDSLEVLEQASSEIELIGDPVSTEEEVRKTLGELNTPEVMLKAIPRFKLWQLKLQGQSWGKAMMM